MGGGHRVIQRPVRNQRQRAACRINPEQTPCVPQQAVTHPVRDSAAHQNPRRPAQHRVARRRRFVDLVGRRIAVFEYVLFAHIQPQALRADFGCRACGIEHRPRPRDRTGAAVKIDIRRNHQLDNRRVGADGRAEPDGLRRDDGPRRAVRPRHQRQGAADAAGNLNPETAPCSLIQRQFRDCLAAGAVLNAADENTGVKPGGDGRRFFQTGQQARRQRCQAAVLQVQHAQIGQPPENIRRQTPQAKRAQIQVGQPGQPVEIIGPQGLHGRRVGGKVQCLNGRHIRRRNIGAVKSAAAFVDAAQDFIPHDGRAPADVKAAVGVEDADNQRQTRRCVPVGRRQCDRAPATVAVRDKARQGNHTRRRIDREQIAAGQRVLGAGCGDGGANSADSRHRPHSRHDRAHHRRRGDGVGRRVGVLKKEGFRVAHIHPQILRPDFGGAIHCGAEHSPFPQHRSNLPISEVQVQRRHQLNDRRIRDLRIRVGQRAELDGCRRHRERQFLYGCRRYRERQSCDDGCRRYPGRQVTVTPENQCQCAANAAGSLNLKTVAHAFIKRQRVRDRRAVETLLNADENIGANPESNGRLFFQVGQQARRQFRQVVEKKIQIPQAVQIHEDIRRQ